jgi:hypothetical protein
LPLWLVSRLRLAWLQVRWLRGLRWLLQLVGTVPLVLTVRPLKRRSG